MVGQMQGGEIFVLEVAGDRDELLGRLADAHATLVLARVRRFKLFLAWPLLGLGIVLVLVGSPFGVGLVPGAAVLLVGYSHRLTARRIERILRRNPFSGEPQTTTVSASGLSIRGDGCESQWAWRRVGGVREHRGGLVVFGSGCNWVHDIPPSAFPDKAATAAAANLIRGWIAASALTR